MKRVVCVAYWKKAFARSRYTWRACVCARGDVGGSGEECTGQEKILVWCCGRSRGRTSLARVRRGMLNQIALVGRP